MLDDDLFGDNIIVLQSRREMLRHGDQIAADMGRVQPLFADPNFPDRDIWGQVDSVNWYEECGKSDHLRTRVLLGSMLGEISKTHYKHPVFMTRAVWDMIERSIYDVHGLGVLTDVQGVWHDILWMSHKASAQVNPSTVLFKVKIDGAGEKNYHYFHLKATVEAADYNNPTPVVTISWQRED